MSDKTFYLHIGSPKTGTSALQYFLLGNRSVLKQKGYDYPEHSFDSNKISSGNAEELARSILDNKKISKDVMDRFMHTECPNVILSSEYLFEIDDSGVAKIKNLLGQADVKIIVYLRRQDSMMISAFNQSIKRHGFKENIYHYYEQYKDKPYFYQIVLERWAKVFGTENIIVRPYEKRQFFNDNIFSDFVYHLNVEFTPEFSLIDLKINPSYRIDALEVKRLLNRLPSLGRSLYKIDKILQQYSESRGPREDWPYSLLSAEQRRTICETHKWINTVIAKNYLGRDDGCLFYDPLPDPKETWKPYEGLSLPSMLNIFNYIAEHSPALERELAEAVNKYMQSEDSQIRATAQSLSYGFNNLLSSAHVSEASG